MTTRFDLGTSKAGIKWWMEGSAKDGWLIQSRTEVDPILDLNKAMATHNDGYTQDRSIRRAASIPVALIQKWMCEEGWCVYDAGHDDFAARKLAQKLNSNEFAYLRTAPGRLAVTNGALR